MQQLKLYIDDFLYQNYDTKIKNISAFIDGVHLSSSRGTKNKSEVISYYDSIDKAREKYITYNEQSLSIENIQVGFLKPNDLFSSIKPNIKRSYFAYDDDWTFYIFSRYIGLYYNCNVTFYPYILPKYKQHGLNDALLFLQGYDEKRFYYEPTDKKYDVTFVGQAYQNRVEKIRYLKNKGINIKVFGAGWDNYQDLKEIHGGYIDNNQLRDIILQSKINLNFTTNWSNDNYQPKDRFLMVSACNAFQLTEASDIYKIWFDESDIATYDNTLEDLYDKVVYYLNNEDVRIEYAQKTYHKVQEYTIQKSYDKVIKQIQSSQNSIDFYKILDKYKDTKVYLIATENINNQEVIKSLENQLLQNITIVTNDELKINFAQLNYKNFATIDKSNVFISFIDNDTVFEPEKLLFQVYSLDNDRRDDIYLNISSYHIYLDDLEFNWVNILTLDRWYHRSKWIDKIILPAFMFCGELLQSDDIWSEFVAIKQKPYRYIRLGEYELLKSLGKNIDSKIRECCTKNQKVALYGGGFFAIKLLEMSVLQEFDISIIFDSNPKSNDSDILGIKVAHIDRFDEFCVDAIIISSFVYQDDIEAKIKTLNKKVNIIKLF